MSRREAFRARANGHAALMECCRCASVGELYGSEAEEYAGEHLVSEETRAALLEQDWSCPHTGRRWLLDYPDRTDQDPGQARLRAEPR